MNEVNPRLGVDIGFSRRVGLVPKGSVREGMDTPPGEETNQTSPEARVEKAGAAG